VSIAESSGQGRPVWFKSSYSNGAGGECVECALTADGALIRDSKSKGGVAITVGHGAWRIFVEALDQGTSSRCPAAR
jgi:hypothetical protein